MVNGGGLLMKRRVFAEIGYIFLWLFMSVVLYVIYPFLIWCDTGKWYSLVELAQGFDLGMGTMVVIVCFAGVVFCLLSACIHAFRLVYLGLHDLWTKPDDYYAVKKKRTVGDVKRDIKNADKSIWD